ncbi:hypothetical protein BH10ACT7_BH10ACT7_20240 [soil metagenome]
MTSASARVRRVLALLLATLAVVCGLVAIEQGRGDEPARAASMGAGIRGITPYGGYLGNYIAPDGSRVYCMDSGRDWPSGSTDGGAVTSTISTGWGAQIGSVELQKVNWALSTYGQTTDPMQAAAVAAMVYAYTSNRARSHGPGRTAGSHYINGNSTVQGIFDQIFSEAEANFAPVTGANGSIDITMANSWDGYVTVMTTPANARGTLTLTGAVDVSTGQPTAQVTNGSVVLIRSTPADSDRVHRVSAAANFTATTGATPTVTVYDTGSQQRTIRGGHPSTVTFSATDQTGALPLEFAPVVRTRVASEFVTTGDAFVDGLVASLAPGSQEWRRRLDGSYLPVTAHGILYGPFTERPDAAPAPPAGAPVVGTESVVLAGPGAATSPGTLTAPEAGFYTWVWTIDAASQTSVVREQLPADYSFADEFGLVAETHIVPIDLVAVSQVSATEIGLGGSVTDELTVALERGSWLTVGGAPVPAVFEGTACFVAGDTPPEVSDQVPAGAVELGSSTVTAMGPGTYRSSAAVMAPVATAGFITWVWRLSPTAEYSSWFEPWSDPFGLPGETTRVSPPTVVTQAVPAVAIGDPVHDTAIVGGFVPTPAAHLVFEAFLQVSGRPDRCDETTRVFESSDHPVLVTAPGSYDSPSTEFTEYGTYYWIESLYAASGELLHRGSCGLPDETTLVAPGQVSTVAMSRAEPGAQVHDTALVEGLVPRGSTLVFDLYRQVSDDGARCDATTRVFTSAPVAVPAAGTYDSPGVRLEATGTYHWVETLRDRHGDALHVGACGASTAMTTAAHSLASTGISALPPFLVAAGLIGCGVVLWRTSRRTGNISRHRALPLS